MLVISPIFGFLGIIMQYVYIADWWHPMNITNTLVGVEDFLFGFTEGGIAAVAYQVIFQRRLEIHKVNKKETLKQNKKFIIFFLSTFLILFTLFYLLKINTFYSTVATSVITIAYVWIKRTDLIINSLASGLLLCIFSLPAFIIPELVTPGWIKSAWSLNNFSEAIILKAPLEDIIWFLLIGAYTGALYKFWRDAKLVKIQ